MLKYGTPPPSVVLSLLGAIGDIAYLFIKSLHLGPTLTGHHFSLPPVNLVVQKGLLGHLPSCGGIGSSGIGGRGESIVKATPIGFSFHVTGETIYSSGFPLIFTASAIGLTPLTAAG